MRNPYQDELAKSLESYDVKVERGDTLKVVFNRIVLRRSKLDILHLHWLPSLADPKVLSPLRLIAFIARLSLLRVLGVKIVWTVHNLIPHEAQYPKVERLLRIIVARFVHVFITHTETAKEQIMGAWFLKDITKVFVIPHGNYIDSYPNNIGRLTARKQLGVRNSEILLLFFGVVNPYKGVLELVDALKALRAGKTRLLIVGSSSNDEFTSSIKRKIKGCHNIEFIPGFVPENQIQIYMNACDVVVFPYREILTSGAVVLAMSFGRACIAPKLGCISDVLNDAGAFLYDPERENGIADAILSSVQKYSDLERMGEYNRERARQWSWDQIAEMTVDVYRKCLDQKTE